ncbi:hypothetical protein [Mycobacterium antarcticum]|uniref:hypothetical protein n=1 Tax=Mycolicibacterium sp. TUM20984 TaxID=3023368 RepID=UPI0023A0B2B8|nr:hypothetical protein [Mycolicibacterium sp. TUM20984]GLP83608.1 hypothetical protein TUM20984_50280 [Mycolicibacterium sp. TUM20984]
MTCSIQLTGSSSPADTGLTLTAYTAEAGTRDHDGLRLLNSWAATQHVDHPGPLSDADDH